MKEFQNGTVKEVSTSGRMPFSKAVSPKLCNDPAQTASDASGAQLQVHKFDFLVIGSGVAGLRYSLAVAEVGTVAIVTKSEPQESSTRYAQVCFGKIAEL